MNILLIDTESSGLPEDDGQVVEIAAGLYNVETQRLLWTLGWVDSCAAEVPPDVAAINGLTPEVLHAATLNARLDSLSDRLFRSAYESAEVAMAHHAEFDKGMLESTWFEAGVKHPPWVCSSVDIKFPNSKQGLALRYTAADHGIAVVQTHEAMADVMLMAACLSKVPDLEDQVRRGMLPKARYVSLAPFRQKDEVKAAGFRWEPERKQWSRVFPRGDERLAELGFEVKEDPTWKSPY